MGQISSYAEPWGHQDNLVYLQNLLETHIIIYAYDYLYNYRLEIFKSTRSDMVT